MPKIKKIAIFSHSSTDHVNWVLGLRSGFMKLGIEVITSWPQPEKKVMNAIIENFKPDAIFEINRSKNQSSINKDIFYITLIQDNRAYGVNILDGFGGSDLYYSIIPPKGFGFDQEIDDQAKPFFAGANTFSYYNPNIEKRFDLGLAGHIGNYFWLSQDFFKKHLLENVPKLGRYIDLYKELQIDHRTVTKTTYINDIDQGIQKYFHKRKRTKILQSLPNFQHELHKIFSMSIARTINRHFTAKSMIKASSSVVFWGPENWKSYPSFQKSYQGFLSGIESLSNGLQSLKINIHSTGSNVHPRIVDGMGLGVPTAIFPVEEDTKKFGIRNFFEPDVDYIDVNFDNFQEKIQEVLKSPTYLREMSERTRKKVQQEFNWETRCLSILRDIESKN